MPVAQIAVQQSLLAIRFADRRTINLRIHVAIRHYQVGPTVFVDIEKRNPPAEELIAPEARHFGDVLEETSVLILIKRRPVAREIRLGDIEKTVAVVIRHGDPHAGLQLSVGVIGDARGIVPLFKSAVVFVAVQHEARCLVACDVNVLPAIVIEIGRDHAQAVACARSENARLLRNVGERPVSVVVIERIVPQGQAVRPAPTVIPFQSQFFGRFAGSRSTQLATKMSSKPSRL